MTLTTQRRRDFKRCRVARVLLNGVDVTDRCFYVDVRRGVVRLYKLNAAGRKFVQPILDAAHWDVPRRVATEERRGRVRLIVPSKAERQRRALDHATNPIWLSR